MALSARLPWKEKLFFGLPIATTFSLGVWQLYRLDGKNRQIQQRRQRLQSPPLQLSDLASAPSIQDLEYCRVSLSGKFRHDAEVLVGQRPPPTALPEPVLQWAGSTGFLVLTPLILSDESQADILPIVVRGWVPQRLFEPSSRDKAPVNPPRNTDSHHPPSPTASLSEPADGADEIVAVIRPQSEVRNRFTPDNLPEKGEWYSIDAHQIAASLGAGAVSRPILIELLESRTGAGWPFAKPEEDHLVFRTPPTTHVTYAVTWFSLCATLSFLTRSRFQSRARRP